MLKWIGLVLAVALGGCTSTSVAPQATGFTFDQRVSVLGPDDLKVAQFACKAAMVTYPNASEVACVDAYLVATADGRLQWIRAGKVPGVTPIATFDTPAVATPSAAPLPVAGCAENGSCYGDISAATGRPKTTAVRGYYRRDGTYVRGHYRSKPR